MTRILPVTDPDAVRDAAAALRRGSLVAFPTETVYGLGADARNAEAVARIFAVKRRPAFDPLIVHLADERDLERVAASRPEGLRKLADRFWPGPLTVVVPKHPAIPDIVTAGLETVAVRIPEPEPTRRWLAACGTPVAAPSANPFGYVSPTTAAHVADQLGGELELILDGGPCPVGLESTVVTLVTNPPAILRTGGISVEAVRDVLGEVRILPPGTPASVRPDSPGQLSRHYATKTPLVILDASQVPPAGSCRVGLLGYREAPARHGYASVELLAPEGDMETAAAGLFAALRRLDALGLDLIVAEPVPERGLGLAIMDRLRRCAASSP
ncbi:MAG TPA: L-threonylcarbamoyladenylate synthase [bacterium]